VEPIIILNCVYVYRQNCLSPIIFHQGLPVAFLHEYTLIYSVIHIARQCVFKVSKKPVHVLVVMAYAWVIYFF